MQSIGQAIESQTNGSYDLRVEQSSATGRGSGHGTTSFGSDLLHALEMMPVQGCEVIGVWKDPAVGESVKESNLTARVRNIADANIAVANGDLSKKITVNMHGGWCLRSSREAGQYGAAAVSLTDVAASLIGGENARR
jgi:hypothetical protein